MKPHIDCVSCGHRFTNASVYSQDDLEYIARRDYGWTWFELGWLCRTCTEESTPCT